MFATRNNCQRLDWLSDCSSEVPGLSMVYVVVGVLQLDDNVALFVVVKVVDDVSPVGGEVSGDDEYFSRAINFNRLIASNACRFSYKSLFK